MLQIACHVCKSRSAPDGCRQELGNAFLQHWRLQDFIDCRAALGVRAEGHVHQIFQALGVCGGDGQIAASHNLHRASFIKGYGKILESMLPFLKILEAIQGQVSRQISHAVKGLLALAAMACTASDKAHD